VPKKGKSSMTARFEADFAICLKPEEAVQIVIEYYIGSD
jgi:hypothetical protein